MGRHVQSSEERAAPVVGGMGVGAGCSSGSYFLISAMVRSKRVESCACIQMVVIHEIAWTAYPELQQALEAYTKEVSRHPDLPM